MNKDTSSFTSKQEIGSKTDKVLGATNQKQQQSPDKKNVGLKSAASSSLTTPSPQSPLGPTSSSRVQHMMVDGSIIGVRVAVTSTTSKISTSNPPTKSRDTGQIVASLQNIAENIRSTNASPIKPTVVYAMSQRRQKGILYEKLAACNIAYVVFGVLLMIAVAVITLTIAAIAVTTRRIQVTSSTLITTSISSSSSAISSSIIATNNHHTQNNSNIQTA